MYRDRQPELFTLDYFYSLQAAFQLADFDAAYAAHLKHAGRLFSTFLVPFFVAIKSPARRQLPAELKRRLATARGELPFHHKKDLHDLLFSSGSAVSAHRPCASENRRPASPKEYRYRVLNSACASSFSGNGLPASSKSTSSLRPPARSPDFTKATA